MKRFQYCLNPHSSKLFVYFRAIQGHSGNNLVDPTVQDNVLLLEVFTEYIFHVGNVSEIYSLVNSGMITGGKGLEGERQSVFFITVNPMDNDQSMEEIRCNLDKPTLIDLKLAQKKGLQFYQTRSHAIVLYNTLPATCFEKAVCMKTNDELYHRVCLPARFPPPLQKPNSRSGRQDHHDQEARES